MIDYPLPIPRNTTYGELGLGPEATAQEIGESAQVLGGEIKRQCAEVERQLGEVYEKVGGLLQATEDVREREATGQTLDSEDYRRARRRLSELSQQAEAVNPRYGELCETLSRLNDHIQQINKISLQNAENRLEYDRGHPPLELLKLAECTRDEFIDRRQVLPLIRRDLVEFFAAHGEEVFHPSDLTREDFSGDFQHLVFLDEPLP